MSEKPLWTPPDDPNDGVIRRRGEDELRFIAGGPEVLWSTSLRDQFAMAALTGLIGQKRAINHSESDESLSRWAYSYADAMLEARKECEPS
jgi:hypothetical protein